MVFNFGIKPPVWAQSSRCWQHLITALPFFTLGSLVQAGWPISALVSGAALAVVWFLWCPCVSLCVSHGGTGSSRDVGVGNLPWIQGEWGWRQCWWIYLLSDVINVILLQLKILWFVVCKVLHVEPTAPTNAAKSWKLRKFRFWSIGNSQLLNNRHVCLSRGPTLLYEASFYIKVEKSSQPSGCREALTFQHNSRRAQLYQTWLQILSAAFICAVQKWKIF